MYPMYSIHKTNAMHAKISNLCHLPILLYDAAECAIKLLIWSKLAFI